MNQLRGDIDITYGVKGTKGEGVMHFRSVRRERMGLVSFFSPTSMSHLLWRGFGGGSGGVE